MRKTRLKIMIAIIDNRDVYNKLFVRSLMNLKDYTNKYHDAKIFNIDGNFIDQMRNVAAEHALQDKYDYIFFLDSDMTYPQTAIIDLLKHKKDIVGGLYYRRKSPHYPVHFKSFKNMGSSETAERFENNKLTKVQASGFGGVLIKTDIFRQIEFPYFKVDYIKGKCLYGEDIYFCKKIKNKFDFWIDPSVKYGHITTCLIVGENQVEA